jgi:hypothetical protein
MSDASERGAAQADARQDDLRQDDLRQDDLRQDDLRQDDLRREDAPQHDVRPHSVWIEAEAWDAGSWDPADEATDVVVTFDDGARWIASFVSYAHVATLVERNRESGACLGGRYLWASDLVLAERVDRPTIEAVVADLIRDGGFESAFTAYGDGEGGAS